MTAILIEQATELAVSLQEAKDGLRVDGGDLDTQITLWVRGITAHAEGYIRRAIMKQKWQMTLSGFDSTISLPVTPVLAVSIKYYDEDGAEQELGADQFRFTRAGVVEPVASWPVTQSRGDAVTITFDCGFGEDADAVPADIKLYVIAKLVEQFDPLTRLEKDTVQASFIDSLLDPHRVAWYS